MMHLETGIQGIFFRISPVRFTKLDDDFIKNKFAFQNHRFFILRHIESPPAGMHTVSVSVTENTHAHSCTHTLSGAMSVVKILVVWYHVNTPLSGMVVVTLTLLTLSLSLVLSVFIFLFLLSLFFYFVIFPTLSLLLPSPSLPHAIIFCSLDLSVHFFLTTDFICAIKFDRADV